MIRIDTYDDGYIRSISYGKDDKADLPADFDPANACEWKYVDGEFVYAPHEAPEDAGNTITIDERLDEIEAALMELAEMLSGGAE